MNTYTQTFTRRATSVLAALAVGVSGLTLTSLAPAQAGGVTCYKYTQGGGPGGRATAEHCNHRGTGENTRLKADCKFSPFYTYSNTVVGSFTNQSFFSGRCTFGVKTSVLQHNF